MRALLLASSLLWWPTFHADNGRTGVAKVDFPSANFRVLWTFSLGEHVYRYEHGASVWSASPAIGEVGGRSLVFIGAYEHNLYAIDSKTGKVVWRYTAGEGIYAAPAIAEVGGRTLVFFAAGDRTVYAVDARSGELVWSREVRPWSYTLVDCFPGSPLVAKVGGRTLCFVTFWFSERRPIRAVEVGEILALDAGKGQILWRRTLAPCRISPPSLLKVGRESLLFVASQDGRVFCLNPRDGSQVWEATLEHEILASPTAGEVEGRPVIIVGTQPFGAVNCLDALTGRVVWNYKADHGVLSTAALASVRGMEVVVFGSLDRCVYALLARTGRLIWKFSTGKYVVASPAVAKVGGRESIFVYSLDNRLYVLSARTGEEVWRFETGEMLWPYETRAASVWSSPAVGMAGGRPILVLPGHDGKLYAFTADPAERLSPARRGRQPLKPTFLLLPVIFGVLLFAWGVSLPYFNQGRKPSPKKRG